jgi:hypothetical protein
VKHLPSWFPGAGFKKIAKDMRHNLDQFADVPFEYVLEEMVSHTP